MKSPMYSSLRCLFLPNPYYSNSRAKAATIRSFTSHSTKEKSTQNENATLTSNNSFLTPQQRQVWDLALAKMRRMMRTKQQKQPPQERHCIDGSTFSRWNHAFAKMKTTMMTTELKEQSQERDSSTFSMLSEQQREIIKAVRSGNSIFITGSAGTGKTFLLNSVIQVLREIHRPKHVFVTASTGVAACALNGQTLHSFAGVDTRAKDVGSMLAKVNEMTYKRWRRARALVIDEISMVSGEFFDQLEFIARTLKAKRRGKTKDRLWGGMQLIVTGDFFQLPPIDETEQEKQFAFEADCWNSSFDIQVELTHIFRQLDPQLIEVLQGIRRGFKNPSHLKLLTNCCTRQGGSDEEDSSVTRLYPRNKDVKMINLEGLRRLGGEIISYRAVESGKEPWKSELSHGIAEEELDLCLGARVMLIKNTKVDCGLVNGATGEVIGFVKWKNPTVGMCCKALLPKVRFNSGVEVVLKPSHWEVEEGGKVLATRTQIPLKLAWALSIHKCQGMTLDSVHTDLSKAFGFGMVYVALSRVRKLSDIHLCGLNPNKIMAHPKVLQFYERFLDGHA